MKTHWIYLLVNGTAVLLIWGLIHYGNRLEAPPALPHHWTARGISLGTDCRLFPSPEYKLTLSQSGEKLSLVWNQSPFLELHGKMDRQGAFELSGTLTGRKREACKRAKVRWRGRADPTAMEGRLALLNDTCPLCPGGMELKATPRLISPPAQKSDSHD